MRAFEFKLRTAALTALAVFFMAFVPFFCHGPRPGVFRTIGERAAACGGEHLYHPHGATRIGV